MTATELLISHRPAVWALAQLSKSNVVSVATDVSGTRLVFQSWGLLAELVVDRVARPTHHQVLPDLVLADAGRAIAEGGSAVIRCDLARQVAEVTGGVNRREPMTPTDRPDAARIAEASRTMPALVSDQFDGVTLDVLRCPTAEVLSSKSGVTILPRARKGTREVAGQPVMVRGDGQPTRRFAVRTEALVLGLEMTGLMGVQRWLGVTAVEPSALALGAGALAVVLDDCSS